MKKLLIISIFISINFLAQKIYSKDLEITIPITIYEKLTKTSEVIIGSSNITIDRDELEEYPDKLLHEIIKTRSGITSRSIYGSSSSGSKTTLDIRGMGAQAKSNVLILINGQRLNNIDMSEIDFPIIQIESIAKIEIYKGNSAAVLYGDGAIGGAINIITNPDISKKNKDEIIVNSGTFNKKEYRWNSSKNFDFLSIDTYLSHMETDGYRDQNESQQNNFTSQFTIPGNLGDHFISLNFNEQIMSTPSDRSQSELYTDRRGSDTPNDYVNSDGGSALYTKKIKINDNQSFIINSSYRVKNSYSDLQTSALYPSYSETFLKNFQFTPRFIYKNNIFNKAVNFTYGLDILDGDYESKRKANENAIPEHTYFASQRSQSLYAQQSLQINKKTTLGAGIRFQKNSITILDLINTSAPNYSQYTVPHKKLNSDENNYAFNIGLNNKINKNIEIYTRMGNGFRFPNVDDRIGGSGDASLKLKTQKTNEFELGFKSKIGLYNSNTSFFIIDAKNEIAYDATNFVNINLNKTRRYGLEYDSSVKLKDNLKLNNSFSFTKAKFRSGDQGSYATNYNGNDIPLVPQILFNTGLNWKITKNNTFNANISYQDDMRMENDEKNFQNTKIPNHLKTDIGIKSIIRNFQISLNIDNLLNERFHNYAVSSASTIGTYNAYPEPGRELSLTISSKF